MAGTELRQVRFEALEQVTGWHIRIVLSRHDEEGTVSEPIIVLVDEPVAHHADTVDQAWSVLLAAMQVLDDLAGHGYDSDSRFEHELEVP